MIAFIVTFVRFIKGLVNSLKDPEFRPLFFFVFLIFLSGTVFYSSVEKWSILNSFYFSVITLLTVGYGDFTPHTDAGKIFTVLYLFIGVGTLIAFVNIIARKSFENSAAFKKGRRRKKP